MFWKLLLQMDHHAGQSISVGLRQFTDGLIQHCDTVAIILDFYKNISSSHFHAHAFSFYLTGFHSQNTCSANFYVNIQTDKKHSRHSNRLCRTVSPAASMKALLSWKVRSGSGRFLRKSLRTPVMTWMSSILLSAGRVFPLISFSFSSFTKRSWPETLYRPTWGKKQDKRNRLSLSGCLWYHSSEWDC